VGEHITGCRFAGRCPAAAAVCRSGPIAPVTVDDQHEVRCVRAHEAWTAGELAAR
jgi:ABC-type dipeptide/oligopeptide/nickel transport system ATPase component